MKSKILIPLLILATYLSSCKKDALEPVITPTPVSQNQATASTVSAVLGQGPVTNIITGYMRLQLAKDLTNTDEVIVDFKAGTKTTFVRGEDAATLQGFGMVSLSSLSSDNVPLAINFLPFPTQSLTIGLKVNAKTDGIYKLNMTTISTIPQLFEIWLMDNYKKDSLDFRQYPGYAFNIIGADTNSYGSHRFSLVIRQNPALGVRLSNFTATKATAGAQVAWTTTNEMNYTSFSIERSTDNGQTYISLSSFTSSNKSSYSFLDKTPATGTDLYRLKVVDLNGTVRYSASVSLSY